MAVSTGEGSVLAGGGHDHLRAPRRSRTRQCDGPFILGGAWGSEGHDASMGRAGCAGPSPVNGTACLRDQGWVHPCQNPRLFSSLRNQFRSLCYPTHTVARGWGSDRLRRLLAIAHRPRFENGSTTPAISHQRLCDKIQIKGRVGIAPKQRAPGSSPVVRSRYIA
jgi:hypothetical protein